ncbi:MFS general substrate transporter [Russula ochroleuca]|uniref:MFS general substrate transporter n=1 Tax=Russula ochroleuca TaxID=152965 RepID=A0A9P5MWA1_9AGAM|nr:MFS general substrate transporter [Russula ochroleuca]
MGLFSNTSDEKRHVSIESKQLDTGAQLDASLHAPLDPDESLRIRRKIDRHILPLMCVLYCIQFMDKATLGNSSILGILKATHLTTNQYNWLGTIFFLGYLAFEFPQNLALQRFPVGKWMSLNIFIWGVALCCHAACKNFAGLFAIRFVLGICEGSTTAGFMIVSSMFYTRREHTARIGYCRKNCDQSPLPPFTPSNSSNEWSWFESQVFLPSPTLIDFAAQIISSFISFGTLHIHTTVFEPWQWLMIITGTLTLITALSFFFLFPDSPTNAWFLTEDERAKAVRRIKENQTGVENKHFKMEQMIEALTDPKTWLFALFSAFNAIPASLGNQLQIMIVSFGFSPLQTTLLGCVSGVVGTVSIFTGVTIASRIPNSIAWVGIVYFVPGLLGVFLVNFLPWHDKVGLLFSIWIQIASAPSFVLSLAWVSQTTAGHTKRITTNAIKLSALCIGSAVGPFIWRAKYKPRNHVPWIIIGVCHLSGMVLLFSIRVLLARENKRRDAEPLGDSFNDVYVVRIDEDGNRTEVKVSKEFLDLTDRQNRDFRYVL